MKELIPLNENVLISPEKIEEKTAGGIIMLETASDDKPLIGVVKAIGNIENLEISVGDKVIFKKYSGTDIEFEKEEFIVVPYADILVKVVEMEKI
ncbi:MAG: co-chaperone GroES [Candidatus Delongbacteria bacterium]|jgi:chaperonin GroES|nr:co-chaperone GroES [Candidatus Delongbacteria bacterium]